MICHSDTFVSNHFSRMLHNQAGAGVSPLQLSAYPTVKGIYNLLKSQPSANCEPFSHPLFDMPGNASKMWRVNPGRLSAAFQSASLHPGICHSRAHTDSYHGKLQLSGAHIAQLCGALPGVAFMASAAHQKEVRGGIQGLS